MLGNAITRFQLFEEYVSGKRLHMSAIPRIVWDAVEYM